MIKKKRKKRKERESIFILQVKCKTCGYTVDIINPIPQMYDPKYLEAQYCIMCEKPMGRQEKNKRAT